MNSLNPSDIVFIIPQLVLGAGRSIDLIVSYPNPLLLDANDVLPLSDDRLRLRSLFVYDRLATKEWKVRVRSNQLDSVEPEILKASGWELRASLSDTTKKTTYH
ncbi:MAG TPA: hypothetical protein VF679_01400 [Pedobacter sp.]